MLFAQEGFTCCRQLWESVIDHLLVTVNVVNTDLLELINAFLRNSLVEVFLLRSQIAKVCVDLGESSALSIDLLIRGLAFTVDAEASVHAIADSLTNALAATPCSNHCHCFSLAFRILIIQKMT